MSERHSMKTLMTIAMVGILFSGSICRAGDPLPEQLKSCVSLKRDAERLACYDRAVGLIQSGNTASPGPSPENMFGASSSIEPARQPSAAAEHEELKQITAHVTAVRSTTEDKLLVLTLDNGQVWRQQDLDAHLTIDVGDSVTIARASLGTFRITDKRAHSARFKRIR
jgi:hypothetical protein